MSNEKELDEHSARAAYVFGIKRHLDDFDCENFDPAKFHTAFNRFLSRIKSTAWDEGYEAGSNDGHAWQDVTEGYVDFDEYEDTPNPYREDT